MYTVYIYIFIYIHCIYIYIYGAKPNANLKF